MSDKALPIHILHLLGSLKVGGVENWLLNVIRNSDPSKYRHSFVVSERTGLEFESRFLALGAAIHVCDVRQGGAAYLNDLFRTVRRVGDVDVMHSHVHAFSAFNLLIGAACGVPVRIAHSHTDRRRLEADASAVRKAYLAVAKTMLPFVMTQGIGVTQAAAVDLFGASSAASDRVAIVPCGVDLAKFKLPADRGAIRAANGVSETDKVVFHTGNFVRPKNHEFAVRLGIELCMRRNDVMFAFAGSGPLQSAIQEAATASGYGHRFLFLGTRSDVPSLLNGLADAFLFPSLWEGLPVALIEAQAAGLPCIVSEQISGEAFAPGADVTVCNLQSDTKAWAAAIEEALKRGRTWGDLSRFDFTTTSARLNSMYRHELDLRSTGVEVA
jgi:glycosyltransferase involved in cell wall biosynthesis